uniref:Uncharacterized protein n=1 Tax=Anguilla anguilla TaxID=7936 RepID=A0A0E9Y1B2_ANGAN
MFYVNLPWWSIFVLNSSSLHFFHCYCTWLKAFWRVLPLAVIASYGAWARNYIGAHALIFNLLVVPICSFSPMFNITKWN